MHKNIRGFTIVELLIVIVVIAILAAISIVAYNGIQNRSNDTAVSADLRNFANKISEFYIYNDRYPQNITDMNTIPIKVNKGAYETNSVAGINLAFCSGGTQAYVLSALSKSGKKFMYSTSGGLKEFAANTINDGLSSGSSCTDILLSGASRVTSGYYSSDTTTGPWRAWTGGN